MKAILMSIKPKWVKEILNGNKTIEIRKRFPKNYVGWVYIYCTKDKKYANLINRGGFLTGMVVARFWCDKVDEFYDFDDDLCKQACLDRGEMLDYLDNKIGYAIHIGKLEIFNKPMKLKCFKRVKWEKCGVKDKNGLYQCHKCPYAIHYGHGFGDCGYDLPLKAPQSWCYVEVL